VSEVPKYRPPVRVEASTNEETKFVPQARLEYLHTKARQETRHHRYRVWMEIEAAELSKLLNELKQRRRKPGEYGGRKMAPLTHALTQMKVGDVLEWEPVQSGSFLTNKRSARKNMGVDAQWESRVQAGLMFITRIPDGARPRRGVASPIVQQIAYLKVGEQTTIPGTRLHAQTRLQARRILKDFDAQWTSVALINKTLRVTRIR